MFRVKIIKKCNGARFNKSVNSFEVKEFKIDDEFDVNDYESGVGYITDKGFVFPKRNAVRV